MRAQRRQHEDPTRYTAYVLWLIGYSFSTIGKVLSLNRHQVEGIVRRSEYADRSSMTFAQRSELLKELQGIRFEDGRPIDRGILDRVPFKVLR